MKLRVPFKFGGTRLSNLKPTRSLPRACVLFEFAGPRLPNLKSSTGLNCDSIFAEPRASSSTKLSYCRDFSLQVVQNMMSFEISFVQIAAAVVLAGASGLRAGAVSCRSLVE